MSSELIECCICYETIGDKNNCTTPCGHKFCFVCLATSLNHNKACPCCREVLVKSSEEDDDDESLWEGDDDDEDDEDEDEDESGLIMSINEIFENADLIYSKLSAKGISLTQYFRIIFSDAMGDCSDEEWYNEEEQDEINDMIEKILKEVSQEIKSNVEMKKEQMMFLQEDNIKHVSALDMIALNYA